MACISQILSYLRKKDHFFLNIILIAFFLHIINVAMFYVVIFVHEYCCSHKVPGSYSKDYFQVFILTIRWLTQTASHLIVKVYSKHFYLKQSQLRDSCCLISIHYNFPYRGECVHHYYYCLCKLIFTLLFNKWIMFFFLTAYESSFYLIFDLLEISTEGEEKEKPRKNELLLHRISLL